jgi:ketosteroid isomerase-like protein
MLSISGFGQSKPSKTADGALTTIHELCRAFETGDTDLMRKNMTDDFTLTGSTGVVTTLADEINDLKTGRVKYAVFKNVDMKPRLYGNTAVVIGKTIVKGEYDKQAFEAEFQFTDTLIWKNGRWRIVSSHASRLKP